LARAALRSSFFGEEGRVLADDGEPRRAGPSALAMPSNSQPVLCRNPVLCLAEA
jgi:hypothetical protein